MPAQSAMCLRLAVGVADGLFRMLRERLFHDDQVADATIGDAATATPATWMRARDATQYDGRWAEWGRCRRMQGIVVMCVKLSNGEYGASFTNCYMLRS